MIELADVLAARERVAETTRHTPLSYSHAVSAQTGAEVHLKLENTQRTGSFKIRGATNRIGTLSETQLAGGVVTASAGNHAQGVALAASRLGVDATVVMPEDAPVSKVGATRNYGAEVVLHGADYDEAATRAREIETTEGRYYLPAFDDPAVMAGQGTIGLEVLEDLPGVDTVVLPVGGGGLIAGVATAIKGRAPDTRVIGVQAAGAAAGVESFAAGERVTWDSVDTIADGIATRAVGKRPFAVITERVDEMVTVSDDQIALAITVALEREKSLVEGAGVAGLAALLAGAFEYEDGETIVPVLCGGNIDLNTLSTVILRGMIATGRYLRIRTVLPDRPGALEGLISTIAASDANVYAIRHDRSSRDVSMNAAELEIDIETRDHDHVETLLEALDGAGYEVERLTPPTADR